MSKNFYASAAAQARGELEEVGLGLGPLGQDTVLISIGGAQTSCDSFLGAEHCRCFHIYAPVYTCSEDPETLKLFSLFIRTIKYHPPFNHPNASFQISFPSARDRLEAGKTYTIVWTTAPGVQAQEVSINVRDSSPQGNYRWFFLRKDLPNTGKYEWHVPTDVKSEGPYIISISYVQPRSPQISDLFQGWSEPFYITIADAYRPSAP